MDKRPKTHHQPATDGPSGETLVPSTRHQQQSGVIKLFGTIKFEPDFNAKMGRGKR